MNDLVGCEFFDCKSQRDMILVTKGSWTGWICYKHPDGQWVKLRKATLEDCLSIVGSFASVTRIGGQCRVW